MRVDYQTVLSAEDMSDTDWRIVDELLDGRVNAVYLRDELDISREYASSRLTRFREHGIVTHLTPSLYELNPERLPEEANGN